MVERHLILLNIKITSHLFTENAVKRVNIHVKKMLCGKEHIIKTPTENLVGKTLLITDLEKKDSIKIQELGIGIGKLYGCGIFLPHKSIAPVAVPKNSE